jgi:hypothetical protein
VPDALKDDAALTGAKATDDWPAPVVSTADDGVTAETPAPTKVHVSRLYTCGDAEGDCVTVDVADADAVGVGVDEGVRVPLPVCVGDSDAEIVLE